LSNFDYRRLCSTIAIILWTLFPDVFCHASNPPKTRNNPPHFLDGFIWVAALFTSFVNCWPTKITTPFCRTEGETDLFFSVVSLPLLQYYCFWANFVAINHPSSKTGTHPRRREAKSQGDLWSYRQMKPHKGKRLGQEATSFDPI